MISAPLSPTAVPARAPVVLVKLLLLFIVLPLVELSLLLWLAQLTGPWLTLAIVIVTGVVGTLLARSQGWRTYRRIHTDLAGGRLPTDSLLDALLIIFAGALLLTPGVLTDAFGLSLLIPLCRRHYRRRLVGWFKSHFQISASSAGGGWSSGERSEIIDSHVVDDSRDDRSAQR